MKIVLKYDLEELREKTVTTMDGCILNVVEAFPDIYGDLRILRFLRKDKIQDPVTAAVRYRQFLRWRTENNVDQIRLQLEERLRLGNNDAFLLPASAEAVDDCLLFHPLGAHPKDAQTQVEIRLEQWDIDKLAKILRKGSGNGLLLQECFGGWIYVFEELSFHLYHESLRTKQMVLADIHCNMRGIRLGNIHPVFLSRILRLLIHTAKSYYPETTVAIHFSCPSKFLSFILMILSSFVK